MSVAISMAEALKGDVINDGHRYINTVGVL